MSGTINTTDSKPALSDDESYALSKRVTEHLTGSTDTLANIVVFDIIAYVLRDYPTKIPKNVALSENTVNMLLAGDGMEFLEEEGLLEQTSFQPNRDWPVWRFRVNVAMLEEIIAQCRKEKAAEKAEEAAKDNDQQRFERLLCDVELA